MISMPSARSLCAGRVLAVLSALVLVGTAVTIVGCGPPSLDRALPSSSGLNVLVVTFDALRADHLGLYGYERPVSPHLDAFAEQAVVFESARVGGQATPTSFAAAFTGRYPHRVFRKWKLESEVTLAEVFRRGGYRTGAFLHNIQMTRKRRFDIGFAEFRVMPWAPEDKFTEAAVEWLRQVGDEPFFLWVHYISPHSPYKWDEVAEHLYDPGYSGDYEKSSEVGVNPEEPHERQRYRQLYDGEIFAVDALFGELMARVEELGLLDDTLVVVSADHGEELGERDVFGHKTLFEEVWRVPFLMRHPDRPQGLRTDVPFSNVDLLPTLAAIVGLEAPAELDGMDARDAARVERPSLGLVMTRPERRAAAILDGSLKLIVRCPKGERQPQASLYDLAADPLEAEDLAAARSEETRRLFEAMKRELGGHPCLVIHDAVRGVDQTEGLDEETIRELEALGYVG